MRKVRMALVAIAAAALMAGLVGEAAGGGDATTAGTKAKTAGKRATVKLGDNFFSPAKKAVRKRTLVRFKWIGNNPHNVVKKKGPGGKFASTTTSKSGINFKKRFKKRGKYKLVCTIHLPDMSMILRVK